MAVENVDQRVARAGHQIVLAQLDDRRQARRRFRVRRGHRRRLPRAACPWLRVTRAGGRAETRRAPDTLVSGAGRAPRTRRRHPPFPSAATRSIFAAWPNLPRNPPRSRRARPNVGAQPADRIPRRRRAAAAQGLFRSAAGRVHRRAAQGIGRGLGRADRARGREDGRSRPRRRGRQAAKPKKIPERSSAPTKTARGTSMGGAASARERAAAGLNPVAGLDIGLEDAERMTHLRRHRDRGGAVGADRERQPAAQERPAVDAAPAGAAGKIRRRHRHRHEVAISSRPATSRRRSRIWSKASTAPTARRCCSASPAPARPSPWPR